MNGGLYAAVNSNNKICFINKIKKEGARQNRPFGLTACL
jgi:hypothetical protein